jgi:hypothetical protein
MFFTVEKSTQPKKVYGHSVVFKTLPKEYNRPIVENSPCLKLNFLAQVMTSEEYEFEYVHAHTGPATNGPGYSV